MPVAEGNILRTENQSASGREWALAEMDARQVAALQHQHDLPELLARLLVLRGVGVDQVTDFLNPTLKAFLPDPSHLRDMDKAAKRVAQAVCAHETIAIFGDYDVDGATSSALLARYFRSLSCEPMIYIPDRISEGYGPNTKALLELQARGASLVITVDCGTLSFEPLKAAAEAGLDVIVVDHHNGEAELPKAFAVVNPNRLDESSPHRHLAAVGVVFLLMVAVNRELRAQGLFANRAEPDLRQWLDIVALGTVCDVVSLTGVNRAFVAQGLKVMAARNNIGIRALMDSAGVNQKPSAYHAGFMIGPRINAGGRVGKSDLGARILSTDDEVEAMSLAKILELHNGERKTIEAQVQEAANAQAEMQENAPLICVSGSGWHPGVIGIVAGRLKERFQKPSVVIAIEGGIGKGSARSVAGFDMGAAIIAAREAGLLMAGGGHPMAAGFTIAEEKIAELQNFLIARLLRTIDASAQAPQLMIDAEMSVAGATPELALMLEQIGPFGQGNPNVRLCVRHVVNLKPEIVGEQHVKTLLIDRLSNARLSAIAFRALNTKLGEALLTTRGQMVDVVGQLRHDTWNGQSRASFTVEDIRRIG